MAQFRIYLKDKEPIVTLEADAAEMDNTWLIVKKGEEVMCQFRITEVQGWRKE
jgi:hypothetical protein